MARRFVLPSRPALSVRADFDADLNEQQRAAVTCGDGPKLVIAGAGTGKTRTLTYRVAYLLSQGVPPDGLLLVTFTNKAAREMVGRVRELTGIDGPRLWAGTFHSIGARLLRRHGALFGYNESFSILDESDQRDVMRLCITDVGVDVKRRRFPAPRLLCSMISLSANTGDPIDEILVDRYPPLRRLGAGNHRRHHTLRRTQARGERHGLRRPAAAVAANAARVPGAAAALRAAVSSRLGGRVPRHEPCSGRHRRGHRQRFAECRRRAHRESFLELAVDASRGR